MLISIMNNIFLKDSDINYYQNFGVTILRNVINQYWINKLRVGVKKNFKNPSKYKCVYEKNPLKDLFYDDYCNWKRINEYKDFFFN